MAEQAESFKTETEMYSCDFLASFDGLRVEGADSEGSPNLITFPESVILVIKTV